LRSVPFLAGLASEGLREGQDFALITRATGGDMAKVPSLLDELVASKVDLLVVSGPPLTRAVHDAIKTLPIVTFDLESDPVESGWLQSYARPGGNLTGVFSDFPDFSTKWLQLLKEIVPGITNLVVLWDPSTPPVQQKAVAGAAQSVNAKPKFLSFGHHPTSRPCLTPLPLDDPTGSYCCRLFWCRSTQSSLPS
jgi:putative tryptophan/tyrosine transport system substrate-binding protein